MAVTYREMKMRLAGEMEVRRGDVLAFLQTKRDCVHINRAMRREVIGKHKRKTNKKGSKSLGGRFET
jgi:hypothetical protein